MDLTHWQERLNKYHKRLSMPCNPIRVQGCVQRIVGLTIEAVGCTAPLGDYCQIISPARTRILSQVVGFTEDKLYLMPVGDTQGIAPGAKVLPMGKQASIVVDDSLLGRIIDGRGQPIDGKGPITGQKTMSIYGEPINPLMRMSSSAPLDVGIRAINSLITIGVGQRIGLFSGSGVGKSVLLGMMTRFSQAQVVVLGLIGERGREVKAFIEQNLRAQGLERCVVIASPADDPPLLRLHGAMIATTVAEYFRAQGKNVLLLMDSLTRFAQAQREIALAVGEMPATKGYPPSVFHKLPQLVERAGIVGSGAGSITAFYTVLAEGDDQHDPIVDAARAILDGHIVLSRQIAESGYYPAIDIEASISRLMPDVTDKTHQQQALCLRRLYSIYQQNRDLISVGAYTQGADPELDKAIALMPRIRQYLCQDVDEQMGFQQGLDLLAEITTSAQQKGGTDLVMTGQES